MMQDTASDRPMRIAALLTCFNRCELTLHCLRGLFAERTANVALSVYLADDASADGTANAVRAAFPQVHLIEGDGSMFWNGGMRKAWQCALSEPYDYYLWLNDDLAPRPGFLKTVLDTYRAEGGGKLIVCGKIVDPDTGHTVYGGLTRASRLSRLRFRTLRGDETICDTMNGNCVLIPHGAVEDVGISSAYYRHSWGDVDYGLRATEAGYRIVQTVEPVGEQKYNAESLRKNRHLTLKNWRFILFHPKGFPLRERLHFCMRFGGVLWPANFVFGYLRRIRLS